MQTITLKPRYVSIANLMKLCKLFAEDVLLPGIPQTHYDKSCCFRIYGMSERAPWVPVYLHEFIQTIDTLRNIPVLVSQQSLVLVKCRECKLVLDMLLEAGLCTVARYSISFDG